MRKYFFIALSTFVIHQSFAQVDPVGAFNQHIAANWTGEYVRISQYRVKGTPYLLGESFPGVISFKGGKSVADKKLLYDLYNQKAGIDVNNQIFESNEAVEEFAIQLPEKFGGEKLLFKNAAAFGNDAGKGYLNVLEDGNKFVFLKSFKIKLSPDPTNTMAKDLKVFEQYYEYYLYNKTNQQLHKIKLKEKDVVKGLGNDPLVKDYLASHEVDFSKETDLIKLIKYYNTNNL